jgi:hypothetical protein
MGMSTSTGSKSGEYVDADDGKGVVGDEAEELRVYAERW